MTQKIESKQELRKGPEDTILPPVFMAYFKGASVRALSNLLGMPIVSSIESKYLFVVNWGKQKIGGDYSARVKVLNQPQAIKGVSDKRELFRLANKLGYPRMPEFTEDLTQALKWQEYGLVFGRKKSSTGGKDITLFDDNPMMFGKAHFWTLYKKKSAEYRIHIMGNKIISRQRKVLRQRDLNGEVIDPGTVNFKVRSHKNGFVFKRYNIDIPKDVEDQAMRAFEISKLDFGAVDVIWNSRDQEAYVLEINTAPGLVGETLKDYYKGFRELFSDRFPEYKIKREKNLKESDLNSDPIRYRSSTNNTLGGLPEYPQEVYSSVEEYDQDQEVDPEDLPISSISPHNSPIPTAFPPVPFPPSLAEQAADQAEHSIFEVSTTGSNTTSSDAPMNTPDYGSFVAHPSQTPSPTPDEMQAAIDEMESLDNAGPYEPTEEELEEEL